MADLVVPIMKSATIIAAGRVGVFHALGKGPLSFQEISRSTGASEHGVRCLVEALVSLGYLEERDGCFCNGPTAQAWLTSESPIDFTPLLHYLETAWRLLADLGDVVSKGSPKRTFYQFMLEHPEAGVAYNQYMKACAQLDTDFLEGFVRIPEGAQRMLDIGGAHGWYTTVLCKSHPGLKAVIFDVGPALAEAKKTVAAEGLGDRIGLQAGDYLKDDLGNGYDVVLCFHLLHWHQEKESRQILEKAAKALKAGGKIILLEKPKGEPPGLYDALFAMLMLLYSGSRPCCTIPATSGSVLS
jgi:SAM-dependent methyltransferase